MSEIVKLLKRGESEKVEFKPSLSQMDKIMESISAFSNKNGGTIVIGVSDKRKTVAHEELADMVNKELIVMVGKGRGVYYILRMKRTITGQLLDN